MSARRLNRGTARLHACRMAARANARQLTVDNLDAARAAVQAVLDDPAASRWLKGALDGAMLRDPIDAAADADKLSRLLREYAGALQLAAAQAVRS